MYRILFYNFNPRSVNNYHLGFRDLGCEIADYSCETPYVDDEKLKSDINKLIDEFRPDIVFSYGWWRGRVNIDVFTQTIREKGVFHIFWAFDDPDCFDIISLPIGRKADLVFTSVAECIDKYKANGIKSHLLLHGCYPPTHRKLPPVDSFKHDIVLLAHNYNVKWDPSYFAFRLNGIKNLLSPLVENDYDVMVWGLWWNESDRIYNLPPKNYGSALPYGMESQVYSSSKIVLGLQTVGNSASHFSVRTFEVLGSGAFHICQYSPALENYFIKGFHMEWTNSPEETLDIVSFYLKHDNLREKVALQGQEEVYRKHTLFHRAHEALQIIKGYI